MSFIATTATKKLANLNKRIRAVAGGTAASKTISIVLLLIHYAQTHDKETISIVSETFPHLKRGAMRDFLNIMEEHKYFNPARWNRTDCIYTFETGSIIEFFSADQPGKVRGPRRQVMFINEANNVTYETYTQLEIRTEKIIWLDWNPINSFWWYEDVMPIISNYDFITLTYKDNEALDPLIVQAIEARQGNKNWWRVYGLGLLGQIEAQIYKDWLLMDEIPPEAKLLRYGLDFGYTNDPTAIVAIYRWNSAFIIDEVAYSKGLTNRQIAEILLNKSPALVIADGAEPKSIDELANDYRINIIGASKGQGSVLQGIQYVQDQKIFVTKRSVNIIKEQRNYLWLTDKDGKIVNEPSPIFNHHMDAIRYGMESLKANEPIPMQTDFGGVKPYIPGLG
jgi:phage terminase large subunit